jgi:glycosyltransferase involved in cell wall biosynthesis
MGGITDMIVDGETGFLVPPSDPASLADAIKQLLADPQRAEAMGQAGRERVRTFTVSAVVERLEGVYRNVVRMRPSL